MLSAFHRCDCCWPARRPPPSVLGAPSWDGCSRSCARRDLDAGVRGAAWRVSSGRCGAHRGRVHAHQGPPRAAASRPWPLPSALGLAYTSVHVDRDSRDRRSGARALIEYGLIAVLFYRVWRHSGAAEQVRRAGDASTMVLPMLCGFIVGTLDEWLQWFIPYRVGEMHDVLLNFTALVCGVLFGVALEPPPSLLVAAGLRRVVTHRRGHGGSGAGLRRFRGRGASGARAARRRIGAFQSRHTVAELDALQTGSRCAVARQPRHSTFRACPAKISNSTRGCGTCASAIGDGTRSEITAAWHENLILERFFAPVLDRPTYVAVNGNRWPPEHRADAQDSRDSGPGLRQPGRDVSRSWRGRSRSTGRSSCWRRWCARTPPAEFRRAAVDEASSRWPRLARNGDASLRVDRDTQILAAVCGIVGSERGEAPKYSSQSADCRPRYGVQSC